MGKRKKAEKPSKSSAAHRPEDPGVVKKSKKLKSVSVEDADLEPQWDPQDSSGLQDPQGVHDSIRVQGGALDDDFGESGGALLDFDYLEDYDDDDEDEEDEEDEGDDKESEEEPDDKDKDKDDDDDDVDQGDSDADDSDSELFGLEKVQSLVDSASNLKVKTINRLVVAYKRLVAASGLDGGKDVTSDADAIGSEAASLLLFESLALLGKFMAVHGPDSVCADYALRSSTIKRFLLAILGQMQSATLGGQGRALLASDQRVEHFNCILGFLRQQHVVDWIVASRLLSVKFIKVICQLMSRYPNRQVRANSLLYLQEHIKCLNQSRVKVQIGSKATSGNFLGDDAHDDHRSMVYPVNHKASISLVLKRAYRAYLASVAAQCNAEFYALAKTSQNCLVELFLAAPVANAYTVAMTAIKEMALAVRRHWNAQTDKKSGSSKASKGGRKGAAGSKEVNLPVLSWPFVQAVYTWAAIIGKDNKRLEKLVFPLVTLVMAAIKLCMPSLANAPFVIHMMTALAQVCDSTNKYIPLATFVINHLERLANVNLQKMAPPKSLAPDKHLQFTLGYSKSQLAKPQTYLNLYKRLQLLLLDHVGIVALHPSFPEYTIPLLVQLKRIVKMKHVNADFCNFAREFGTLVANSKAQIIELRSKNKIKLDPKVKLLQAYADKIPLYQARLKAIKKHQEALATLMAATTQTGSEKQASTKV